VYKNVNQPGVQMNEKEATRGVRYSSVQAVVGWVGGGGGGGWGAGVLRECGGEVMPACN